VVLLSPRSVTPCYNGTQFEGRIWVSNRIWSGPDGNRTRLGGFCRPDPRVKSPMLYLISLPSGN
jgi:hypothetical protein